MSDHQTPVPLPVPLPAPLIVLLIEDNAGDARLIRELLAEPGTGAFRLEHADRLSTGLARLDQGSIDLVLLDLSLPDSDGLATVAAVRKYAPQLPVIVLTGHDDDRLAVATVGAGAQDYLVKGRINGDSLARSIRHAIERKRVADALKETSIFNALLLQTSPLGMDIVDEDGTVLFVSPALEAVIGESPVGKRCWDIYKDDKQQCVDCPLKRSIDVGETKTIESLGLLGKRDFDISHTGMVYRGRKAVLEVFHDVTERKRAEAALRESENRLRTIVEGTQALLTSVDANGHFTYANDATARAAGYASPEELLGKPYLHFVHPGDRQQVLNTFRDQTNTRQPSSIQEFRIVDTEGKVRWLSFLATLVIKDGQVVGQNGVAQDITERKQAEEAQQRSEQRYRALFQDAPAMYVITREVGGAPLIVDCNETFCHTLGFSHDELLGQPLADFYTPASRAQMLEGGSYRRALAGEPVAAERDLVTRDGRIVSSMMRAVPEMDATGRIFGTRAMFVDITERKQAEEVHRLRESYLTAILENQPGLVWLKDVDGRFLTVNQAFADSCGKASPVELASKTDLDIWPRELAERYQADDAAVIKTKAPKIVEEPIVDRGEIAWFETFKTPILDGKGDVIGTTGYSHDISERKRTEAERQCLLEIMRGAATAESLQQLLALIRQSLANVIYAENFFVVFHNNSTGMFEEVFAVDQYDAPMSPSKLERSMTSYVFRTGEPLLLTGAKLEELMAQGEVDLVGTKQAVWLGAPLKTPSETLGVMVVQNYEDPNCYSERDREFFVSVSAQVALAIARKRVEEALRQRMGELEAVSRVTSALREAGPLQQILDILLDETLAILGADSGGIWLHDPDSDHLHPAAVRGWFASLPLQGLHASEGIAGATFVGGQAIVSREFRDDPRTRAAAHDRLPEGWGGACIPLRTAEEVVGVLYVSVQLPREIEHQELSLLNTLAEIGGNAIHRTRLHEQTGRQLAEAEALRDVERAVASSFDLGLTLGLVAKHAAQLLGADASTVLVLSAHSHNLEYAAWPGIRSLAPARTRLGLTGSCAGRVAMERQMIFVDDLPSQPDPSLWPPFYAAEGFVSYYAVPIIAKGALKGVLEVLHRTPLVADPHWQDLVTTLAGQAAIAIDNNGLFDGLQRSNAELTMAYEATIEGWSRALDLRDKETEGHSQRVTEMAVRLAGMVGVPESALMHVRRGALLHDIGKLGVPDQILLKPGPLTDEEWVIMRKHPLLAYDLLAPIAYLNLALDIPYCHHEKWDGTGYPRQLKGEEIPLAARVFAVADVWDALSSDRPYRMAWPREKIMTYMREQSGLQFDPRIVDVFLAMKEE